MTVNCDGSNGCQYAKIYCPNAECNIICDGYYSCYYMAVYADYNTTLTINCTYTYSCNYAQIYVDDAPSTTLNCLSPHGCYSTKIYGENAGIIDVNCVGNGTYYSYASCYYLYIAAERADAINLYCHGTYACYNPTIHGDNAGLIDVYAEGGAYAMYNGYVYASNASYFEIDCVAHGAHYACYYPHLVCIHHVFSLQIQLIIHSNWNILSIIHQDIEHQLIVLVMDVVI